MLPVSLPRVSTCVLLHIQISVLPTDRYSLLCKPTYKCMHICSSAGNNSLSSIKCKTLVYWDVPFQPPLSIFTASSPASSRRLWFPIIKGGCVRCCKIDKTSTSLTSDELKPLALSRFFNSAPRPVNNISVSCMKHGVAYWRPLCWPVRGSQWPRACPDHL